MYQPECNLVYQYDASGAIIGFTYHPYSGTASQYFFGKNARGDVICIYDATGNTVARYNYDTDIYTFEEAYEKIQTIP